ncbi:endonuclease/exonuclease/phosphatase family protein [Streptomyces sp. DSM 44915]|uniref:Endonuclease/exonuclease/phosphatase family protein n=1 Tax=Streptomyces chisholmiae TaxID=3075540 RepID=A0ABU2JUE7_9ACTN|nr:endonuclease/exonuclease/phosphatase family protein [Streptomyces sp. DSM 44915]MDT0268604.1 endonuclease/exonuclease/phosphatase family protein [Streptomyces sp. DSM 44915]
MTTTDTATVEPVQEPAPPPRPRPPLVRVVAAVALAWMVFALAHNVLTGNFWLWVIPGTLPPITFLVVPLLLLVGGAFLRGWRPLILGRATIALVVGLPWSGINLAALDGADWSAGPGPIVRVVTLNTDYWAQNRDGIWTDRRDRGALFDYLRSLDADVYLLQEHMRRVDETPVPITDLADVREAFSEYEAVADGTLLTLSRLPVAGRDVVHSRDEPALAFPAPYGLRVDHAVGEEVVSTYNVHMPVQLMMEENPLTPAFYREIRERQQRRAEEYRALTDAVADNPHPLLVAGDFNTSPAMGDNRALLDITTDAVASTGLLHPTSWRVGGGVPQLWRNDWALVAGGLGVRDYRFLDPDGNSDHTAQLLELSVPTAPEDDR